MLNGRRYPPGGNLRRLGLLIAESRSGEPQYGQDRHVEDPSVDQMIRAHGQLIVRQMRQHDDAKTTKTIPDQRNDYAGDDEEDDLVPFAIAEMREQHAQRQCRDQEPQTRAGFGNLETPIRQLDESSLGKMGNPE